jgi:hypothetical protein
MKMGMLVVRLENQQAQSGLNVVQMGLNTMDMPAMRRLYSEVLGFANGGAVPGVPFFGVWQSS